MKPRGPFNLLHQNQYFNGWPTLASDPKTVVMAFPVEGWQESAAVTLTQKDDGRLELHVYGAKDTDKAKQQALAAMSLDEDGSGWKDVGKRDEFVAQLQEKYQYLRPTLFHSGYEAAASFIIGNRITIVQTRKIRAAMSLEMGQKISVKGEDFYAFPTPQTLLELESYKGINDVKIQRLHAVAQAALDGKLDRDHLRAMAPAAALAELETLPGIGPFFSQGILYRGVGIPDGLTQDEMSLHGIRTAYNLPEDTPKDQVLAFAERWRPYRMWVTVLLHIWMRETGNFPAKREFKKR